MASKPTIKDVAERAGCGVSTVSRVLNRTGSASAETRQRVLDAAQALRFEFSDVGRSLQSQRTRAIGCLVPSLVNPVFADAIQALQAEVLTSGYHLILMCSDYSPDLELAAIRMLIQKDVEAIALTVSDAQNSRGLALVRDKGIRHCLMFNAPAHGEAAFFVRNGDASEEVAAAFAAAGHRKTGFLALRFRSSDRSRERFDGFCAGCHRHGLLPPVLLEIDEGQADLRDQLQTLLSTHHDLTGIFASNDFLALAAMRGAREMGRKVPEALSIVGFDGISVGTLIEPSLATVVTDPRAMGRGAAAALIEAIETGQAPIAPTAGLPFEFRRGGSLCPPAQDIHDAGKAATFPASLHHPVNDRPANQEQ